MRLVDRNVQQRVECGRVGSRAAAAILVVHPDEHRHEIEPAARRRKRAVECGDHVADAVVFEEVTVRALRGLG